MKNIKNSLQFCSLFWLSNSFSLRMRYFVNVLAIQAATILVASFAFAETLTVLFGAIRFFTAAAISQSFRFRIIIPRKRIWISCYYGINSLRPKNVICLVRARIAEARLNKSQSYLITHFARRKADTVHFQALALPAVAPGILIRAFFLQF